MEVETYKETSYLLSLAKKQEWVFLLLFYDYAYMFMFPCSWFRPF